METWLHRVICQSDAYSGMRARASATMGEAPQHFAIRKGRFEKTHGFEKTHAQIVPQLRPKPDAIAPEIRRNCVGIQPQLRENQPQLRGSRRAIASEPRAICVGSAERARFASERRALCVGAQCDVRQCDASPSLGRKRGRSSAGAAGGDEQVGQVGRVVMRVSGPRER